MDATVSREHGGIVLFVSGELDAVTCTILQEQLDELFAENVSKLILDLSNVHYISSAGLRVLLGTAKKMDKNGVFSLSRPTAEVKEILEMVGFETILTIYDNLDTARKEVLLHEG